MERLKETRRKRNVRRTPKPADVVSGRMGAGGRRGATSQGRPGVPDPAALPGARPAPLPREPRPQLATLVPEAPAGADWIHEIKFDGYRIMALLEQGRVRLVSRNGKDWSGRFPGIAATLEHLPADRALLDGEVVALGPDGISSFRRLQEALSQGRAAGLIYQIFDLLHLDGCDLTAAAALDRKQALAQLLTAAGFPGETIRYTDHLEARGPAFLEQACRLGLEGIICKRADSRYSGGRSKDWLKVKCTHHEELVIGGYTEPAGSRTGFGALLLGAWDEDGRLVHVGRVGTGFSRRQLEELHAILRAREVATPAFHSPPAGRGVHWVRPELVAEVEFAGWTRDGQLRHTSFRGLREDRDADEIRLPRDGQAAPQETAPERPPRKSAPSRGEKEDAMEVAGIRLTNAQRILYPEQGATKLDLARYYEDIRDWILPHLTDRPLSLVRCPRGREKQCFFQKHPGEAIAASVPRVEIREKEGLAEYLVARSLPDVVALVQAGVLEFHVWGSRVDDLERPDRMLFDLDPGPGVAWPDMLDAATGLRDRLDTLGLPSFLRTTGGKGLHLVVPLRPGDGWEEVRAFARAVCERHAGDDPRRFTTEAAKARRKGRIFLDYLRNGRGATAIASYSTRARKGAPVAVPLRWDELGPDLRSDQYTIANLRRRLAALRADPWEGFEDARHPLTRGMHRTLGLE